MSREVIPRKTSPVATAKDRFEERERIEFSPPSTSSSCCCCVGGGGSS